MGCLMPKGVQGEGERGQRSRSETGPTGTESTVVVVVLVPKQDKPGKEETWGNLPPAFQRGLECSWKTLPFYGVGQNPSKSPLYSDSQ